MNPRIHAVRVGLRRGWTEFVQSLKSRQDLVFYVFVGAFLLWYLISNRDNTIDGTDLPFHAFAVPSLLGGLVVFGSIVGPASAMVLERQDGALLRSRLAPYGLVGYTTGQITLHALSTAPMLAIVLVPSLFLFDGAMGGSVDGWLLVLLAVVLGLFATLPFGLLFGAIIPGGPQKLGLYVMLPMSAIMAVSGIFFPINVLWGWVQVIAQVLPMYWLGHLMRAASLPAEATVFEASASFQPVVAAVILLAWGVVGAVAMPPVLRRMSRRQSGSQVAAERDQAGQFVR